MMKNTCTAFLLVFSTTLAVGLCAAPLHTPPEGLLLDRQSVIAAAREITPERYPDADRVLADNHVLKEYFDDATSIYWDDDYTKILTEKGRREGASHTFHFNVSYGTSFVYRAEIIKPDGAVIPIDVERYSKVMTEQSQMSMNIYDPNNKVLVLSIPGVEIGDICHIIYCRVTHKARMKETWADHAVFEFDSPIVRLDYAIIAPPGLPIKHRLIRDPVAGTVKYTASPLPGNRTRHLWQVREVPRMFPEPDMPPLHTQVQRLLLSTATDWKTVSRWYWELCREPMSRTTPEMEAKVRELTAGVTGYHDKIRAIFKFVSQNIRYMGITTEDEAPGYEPHPVDMTFNNRYGVCRDKAALLAAMLRLAGIPAYPVLIHAGAKMDPDIPVPFFNHAITAADDPDGGYILMEPTDENTKDLFPAYLCNRSFLVAREEGETLLTSPVFPAAKNMMRIESSGTLDASGALLLKTSLDFGGINDNAYRGFFLRNKQEQRRKFFEAALKKTLAGAEVLECRILPENLQDTGVPLSVELTSRIPDYPVRGESLDMLIMPWLSSSIGYVNFVIGATGLDKRRYTMQTDITCGVKESVTLRVADAMKRPRHVPEPFALDSGGILFSLDCRYENGELRGTLEQRIETPEFSPEEYLVLKNTLKEIEAQTRKRPLFEAGGGAHPDHEMLFSETRTVLHTPDSWSTTTRWSKRILTYAGKKQNAEIKFTFNPAWQSVELVSATVSNTTGRVFPITEKEINLMDADWAASAPRYPAGKTLIVNLPGVETGSVITVETRSTRTNANFYATAVAFGGTSPSADELFEITWPRTLKPAIQAFNLAERVEHTAHTNAATITMRWRSEKPPLIELEPALPPRHFHNPEIFISFGDWKSYARALGKRIKSAGRKRDLAEKMADRLTDGVRNPHDKILAIRDEVLRTVRIAGPSFIDLPPDSLSDADTTLADQYGHALDRAILLAAMLDEAGFDPEIVLASGNRSRYPQAFQPLIDTPQPAFFANPLVKVRTRGATYYLNDGDQYTELGVSHFHDAPALDLRGNIAYVEVPEERRDLARKAVVIDLAADGTALITVTNFHYGTSFGPFRKKYSEMLPEERRRHALEIVNSVAKSATAAAPLIADYDSFPGTLSYAVTAPDYAVVANGTLTLNIPEIAGPVFPVSADSRVNPLFLGSHALAQTECTVILPAGYTKLALLPQSRSWVLPEGTGAIEFTVGRSATPEGRTVITLARRIKLASGELPPELYPAVLEYNRIATHPSMRTLIAEKP